MSGGSLEDFFESKSHAHARLVSGNGFDADLRELVLSWTQDCERIYRFESKATRRPLHPEKNILQTVSVL
jgi:hypothetical protein